MGSIAIVTDTNSGIMSAEADALGVHVVPMPFVVDGVECFASMERNTGSLSSGPWWRTRTRKDRR